MNLRLIVVQGDQKGDYLNIERDKEARLGRKQDCELFLQDELLSRYHCRLYYEGDTLYVEDLQSRNGTFINGDQVEEPCPVALGDFISIGSHLLKCIEPSTIVEENSDTVLCSRCGAPVLYPQPQPPYICLKCYKKYFQSEDLPPGFDQEFGPFEIQSLLGEGGVSSVYLAIDNRNNNKVALKLLKTTSDSYLRRFEREGNIYKKLSHPNIVNLIDSGCIEDTLYIAMEYLVGENLHEYVCRLGSLSDEVSLKIIKAAADGLACAHDMGVIHRDIKPGNMVISEQLDVKVVDFGLAKNLTSQTFDGLTKAGSGLGSLMYVSPEQLVNAKNVDARTDIYGLGATLYFMKTVNHPFASEAPAETIVKIQQGNLDWSTLPRDTNPLVLEILRGCLQVEPHNRFPTSQLLAEAAEEALKEIASK